MKIPTRRVRRLSRNWNKSGFAEDGVQRSLAELFEEEISRQAAEGFTLESWQHSRWRDATRMELHEQVLAVFLEEK